MIYLIGESNPYGADPYYALYPQPSNATGGRLCHALRLSDDEYLDKYERRNLLVLRYGGKWSAPAARKAAVEITQPMADGDALVLLGAKVAAAFLLDFATQLLMPVVYRADRQSNLEWGTHTENVADQSEHGTDSRGERNGQSKLTQVDADFIRHSPEPGNVLADRFGVSQATVCRIRKGLRYAA